MGAVPKGILRVLSFIEKARDLIDVDLPGLTARFLRQPAYLCSEKAMSICRDNKRAIASLEQSSFNKIPIRKNLILRSMIKCCQGIWIRGELAIEGRIFKRQRSPS